MKYRHTSLIFIIIFLIQTTVMAHFRLFGVTPNIVLCFIILLSFLYEDNKGMIYGVIAGLIFDLIFSVIVGPAAIAYFTIALLMELLRRLLYKDSVLSIFFVSIIGTFMFYFINWGIISIFINTYDFMYVLKKLPIITIYNFIFMFIFYITIGKKTIKYPQDLYYKRGSILHYE